MSENEESGSEEEIEEPEVTISNNLQKAIADAFWLFTSENNRQNISINDLGKVIRHLGCVPSEIELKEFAKEVTHPKYPNIVKLNAFMRHMEAQVRTFKYRPGSADEILQAFRLLDSDGKGSLSIEQIQVALRSGESFDSEEIAEAIKTAYDPQYGFIHYDLWVNKLLVDRPQDMDAFQIAPIDTVTSIMVPEWLQAKASKRRHTTHKSIPVFGLYGVISKIANRQVKLYSQKSM